MIFHEEIIQQSVREFQKRCDLRFDLALVLGSGLDAVVHAWQSIEEIPFSGIFPFQKNEVEGHKGSFSICQKGDLNILCMRGRYHLYQGYSAFQAALPVAMMGQLGIQSLVLTNACGSLNSHLKTGDIMLIEDHINLQGQNCLTGAPQPFIDMSVAYDAEWRKSLQKKFELKSGVYAAFNGPSYETPAEVRMAGLMGADAVGMSTVQEVIMARYHGMRVLGLSMISNPAAGTTNQQLSHQEVLRAGKAAGHKVEEIIHYFLKEVLT